MTVTRFDIPVTPVTGAGGSEQGVYIASSADTTQAMLEALYVVNTGLAAVELTAHIVPLGAVASTSTIAFKRSIAAGGAPETVLWSQMVASASTLQVSASVASVLNVYGSHREIT